MKFRITYSLLLILMVFCLSLSPIQALDDTEAPAPRYVTCDLCGYCLGQQPPSNWASCAKCLYGDGATIENQNSLKVDLESNSAPTPIPGHYYTMIGCLSSNLMGGFTEKGAASGVIQSLLTIIFSFAGTISFFYIMYGGFVVATSQANPERLNYGKRTVFGAIVGLIFSLGVVFIVNFISSTVLKIPGF